MLYKWQGITWLDNKDTNTSIAPCSLVTKAETALVEGSVAPHTHSLQHAKQLMQEKWRRGRQTLGITRVMDYCAYGEKNVSILWLRRGLRMRQFLSKALLYGLLFEMIERIICCLNPQRDLYKAIVAVEKHLHSEWANLLELPLNAIFKGWLLDIDKPSTAERVQGIIPSKRSKWLKNAWTCTSFTSEENCEFMSCSYLLFTLPTPQM